MKKSFSGLVLASAVMYISVLYFMLFVWFGREMVIMSEGIIENYNYWNSINLIPFKTITEYTAAVADESIRGHAIRNLSGNLFLFFPIGFYLPFFLRKADKIGIYSIIMAVVIIVIEIIQIATKTGSFDVDDFILNFVGALIGFFVFTRTPISGLLKLRAW